jgi:hypothetical protein
LRDAQHNGHGRYQESGADRHQIDERPTRRVSGRRRLGNDRGQAGLAHATGTEQRHEPGLGQPLQDNLDVPRPPDERGPAERDPGQPAAGGRWPGRRPGDAGQRPAVGRPKFAQQRRDVAFDSTHGDVQAVGDLRVGQVLPDRGKHFRLPGRDLLRLHHNMIPYPASVADPW